MLSRITRGGYITGNAVKQNQYYNMSYDSFGNMTVVSIGQNPDNAIVLATYDYGEQNGHLNSMTYGNGDSITYHYDDLDRLTVEAWGDGTSYEYFYNSEGALTKKVDTAAGNTVNYEYDGIGRLIHSSVMERDESTQEDVTTILTEHIYDRQNRVKEQSYQIRNSDGSFKTYSFAYTYRGSDGSLERFQSTDNYIDAYTLSYDTPQPGVILYYVKQMQDYETAASCSFVPKGENSYNWLGAMLIPVVGIGAFSIDPILQKAYAT